MADGEKATKLSQEELDKLQQLSGIMVKLGRLHQKENERMLATMKFMADQGIELGRRQRGAICQFDAKLGSDGRITIPQPSLEMAGLKKGDVLTLSVVNVMGWNTPTPVGGPWVRVMADSNTIVERAQFVRPGETDDKRIQRAVDELAKKASKRRR